MSAQECRQFRLDRDVGARYNEPDPLKRHMQTFRLLR
jgi:hypothetical protein